LLKTPVEYYESVEVFELAEKIRNRYVTHLHHVELDTIYFCVKVGEKPQKTSIGEISGISSPWVKKILQETGSEKLYCLSVWADNWDDLHDEQKQWLMFYLLYSVNEACDGKIRKADITNEYGFMLEFLGPYWRLRGDLPNMLDDDDVLPLPPPYVDLDSESDVEL
jgi:hypothetical protein